MLTCYISIRVVLIFEGEKYWSFTLSWCSFRSLAPNLFRAVTLSGPIAQAFKKNCTWWRPLRTSYWHFGLLKNKFDFERSKFVEISNFYCQNFGLKGKICRFWILKGQNLSIWDVESQKFGFLWQNLSNIGFLWSKFNKFLGLNLSNLDF